VLVFHHYRVEFLVYLLVLVQHLIFNYPVRQVFQVLLLVFLQEC
jgi:hypothetical protein